MNFDTYLKQVFRERPFYLYAEAFLVIVAAVILSWFIRRTFRRNRNDAKDDRQKGILEQLIRKLLVPALYFGAFYIAADILEISGHLKKIIEVTFTVFLTWFTVRLAGTLFRFSLVHYIRKTETEEQEKRIRPLLSFVNLIIWLLGVLFVLDNLGFQISTVIAGLGIGGIAVALAAQTILGDLFSYFVIYFDRPFELGDFIILDDILGSVEQIGIKTTKIRSLAGEQIVISNSILTGSRIRNYKRMEKRRIVFSFGVLYETPPDKVRAVPEIVRDIIQSLEHTQFDRAHFKGFGNSSLDFEVVYYVLSPDYLVYMDIQQAINLRLMEVFRENDIGFAYPTRTVYVKNPSYPPPHKKEPPGFSRTAH